MGEVLVPSRWSILTRVYNMIAVGSPKYIKRLIEDETNLLISIFDLNKCHVLFINFWERPMVTTGFYSGLK